MTTAILVDDEANLLTYLQRKLNSVWPELSILGTAQNGRQALALAAETEPDIAFLDIHMPGLSGLEVAAALPDDVQIVFVTAFDDYAVQAFEAAAVDYLLKPYSDERLQQTVARLQQRTSPEPQNLAVVIEALSKTGGGQYLSWLRTGRDNATRLVPIESVVYFKADQKYTSVFTATEEHLIRTSIKDLEEQLDPNQFWRIHRGIIVRIAEIIEARRDIRGRYTLSLKSRPEQLRASTSYGYHFKQM